MTGIFQISSLIPLTVPFCRASDPGSNFVQSCLSYFLKSSRTHDHIYLFDPRHVNIPSTMGHWQPEKVGDGQMGVEEKREEKRDIGGRARCTENEQEVHFKSTIPLSKQAPIPTAMTKATQNRVYYGCGVSITATEEQLIGLA